MEGQKEAETYPIDKIAMDVPANKPQTPPEAPQSPNLIEKAESIAKRLEEANKRAEELARRNEETLARLMLSGRAQAGTIQKTPEQEEEEQINKEVEGTLRKFNFKR